MKRETAEKYVADHYKTSNNKELKKILYEVMSLYGTNSFEQALDVLSSRYGVSYSTGLVELPKGKIMYQPYVRLGWEDKIKLNCYEKELYTLEEAKIRNVKTVLYHLETIIR